MIRSFVSSQSQPSRLRRDCGGNWLAKNEGGVGKGADAMTVNRGLDLARREEKLDMPCVPISLETVSVGGPSIEITAETDCPKFTRIGEHNWYLAGCLMNYVPI